MTASRRTVWWDSYQQKAYVPASRQDVRQAAITASVWGRQGVFMCGGEEPLLVFLQQCQFYDSLVRLCTDICRRNGKKKLLWFGDKNQTLDYNPKPDEMVLTVHRWFANKSCPGNWLYARLGDLAAKVTAALGSSQQTPSANDFCWYRVRKTWPDAKSQKGAFHSLANAKKCADSNAGYKVFDKSGNAVYPAAGVSSVPKSMDAITKEVIRGDWGNGAERKQRLTAAGYNYSVIQKRVNEILR